MRALDLLRAFISHKIRAMSARNTPRCVCALASLVLTGCAAPRQTSMPEPPAPQETFRCEVRVVRPDGTQQISQMDLTRTVRGSQLTEDVRPTEPAQPGSAPPYVLSLRAGLEHVTGGLRWPDAQLGVDVEGTATEVESGWPRYTLRTRPKPLTGGEPTVDQLQLTREAHLRPERLTIETFAQAPGDSAITRTVEDCVPMRLVPTPFQHP